MRQASPRRIKKRLFCCCICCGIRLNVPTMAFGLTLTWLFFILQMFFSISIHIQLQGQLTNSSFLLETHPFHRQQQQTSLSTIQNNDKNEQNEEFSACLMFMDDNSRLVEWLAYQYYTMNLRHVVIRVDDKSKTMPLESILNRWKNRIDFYIWHDDSRFIFNRSSSSALFDPSLLLNQPQSTLLEPLSKKITNQHQQNILVNKTSHQLHKAIQREFNRQCMLHMITHNRTWTMFLDVDEYIVVRPDFVKPNATFWMERQGGIRDLFQLLRQPGGVRRHMQQVWDDDQLIQQKIINKNAPIKKIPLQYQTHSCVGIGRKTFSSWESPLDEVKHNILPLDHAFFDPTRLDTLRYRHARPQRFIGKSLVDVSQFTTSYVETAPMETHRLLPEYCSHPWGDPLVDPFIIHHYVGSWQAFSDRPNDRRGVRFNTTLALSDWNERGKWMPLTQTDRKRFSLLHQTRREEIQERIVMADEIRPWIRGFIRVFGRDRALQLLEGAGYPRKNDDGNESLTIMKEVSTRELLLSVT